MQEIGNLDLDAAEAALGVNQDSFGYADRYDEASRRDRGLRGGEHISISDTDLSGLLVKPDVALRQPEGRIADEVVAHLAGLVGADVKVTLEIEADIPGGAPEPVIRTVTENSRTLGFRDFGFEED